MAHCRIQFGLDEHERPVSFNAHVDLSSLGFAVFLADLDLAGCYRWRNGSLTKRQLPQLAEFPLIGPTRFPRLGTT
jgi:hypothetical protein